MVVKLGLKAPPSTPTNRSRSPSASTSASAGTLYPLVRKGVLHLEGQGLTEQNRLATRSRVLQVQDAGFEEVTPEEVEISIVVHVGERHRVRPVEAPGHRSDDLDALKTIFDEAEKRRAVGGRGRCLVACDRAVHTPQKEIPIPVAADVIEARDVLPVGEKRLVIDVTCRVTHRQEHGPPSRALVPEVLHVAERPFGQQIEVAIAVEIEEATPLADLQVLKPIGAPYEAGLAGRSEVLEVNELTGALLEEEVQVSVPVEVGELGPGHVQSAQERRFVGPTRFIQERESVHHPNEPFGLLWPRPWGPPARRPRGRRSPRSS